MKLPKHRSPGCVLFLAELFFLLIAVLVLSIGITVLVDGDRIYGALIATIAALAALFIVTCMRETLRGEDYVSLQFERDLEATTDLVPRESESLATVRKRLSDLPSDSQILAVLKRAGPSMMGTANPKLQPISFAFRPTTTSRYIKGIVRECLTWTMVALSAPFLMLFAAVSGWLAYEAGKKVLFEAVRQSRKARRYRSRPHQILRDDDRDPVLYLRAFSEDYGNSLEGFFPTTTEETLASHYAHHGPMLTIGQPNEDIPLLGASRIYFEDETWTAGVLYLMSISQMIVLQAGFADGLLWELSAAYLRVPPQKFLLSFAAWKEIAPEERSVHYLRFKKYVGELIGLELPEAIGDATYLAFDSGWKYKIVK